MKKARKNRPQFYVLTGGPGAGKTSVLNQLASLGFPVVEEGGRKILQIHGKKSEEDFTYKMLIHAVDTYHKALKNSYEIVFFDRSMIDVISYARLKNIALPSFIQEIIPKIIYETTVFIFPPWEEIYINDEERLQTYDEAIETYNMIESTYQDCGYMLIQVPKTDIQTRAEFLLSFIKKRLSQK